MEHHKIFIISDNKQCFHLIKNFLESCNLKLCDSITTIRYNQIKNLGHNYPNLIKDAKVIVYLNNEFSDDYYTVFSSVDSGLVKYLVSHCVNAKNNHRDIIFWNSDLKALCNKICNTLNISDHDKVFEILSSIKITHKNKEQKEIIPTHTYINTSSPYNNTDDDKKLVLNIVDGLFNETNNITDELYGSKNLVYYTVFGSSYTKLFDISLQSIHKFSPNKNFDLLVICDIETKREIESLGVTKYFNIVYHLVDKPKDGIQSSINKCKIYSYDKINEYNKILFLDCDILSIKNINSIFDISFEANTLYTVCNAEVKIGAHNSKTHGIIKKTKEELEILEKNNQNPFNAGQFLFINSLKMQKHFYNLLWLIDNWPGEYFFEQCFMVYYFCTYMLSNNLLLKDNIQLTIITNNYKYQKFHKDKTSLLHFAGYALDASKKIEYISAYFYSHKL